MIHYIVGDATRPARLPAVIAHIVNDVGAWGAGFVLSLADAYPLSRTYYRTWFLTRDLPPVEGELQEKPFRLGEAQICNVGSKVYVANMIAQHRTGWHGDMPPIRYDALESCLKQVAEFAKAHNYSVHMPRIGTGLAGGDWSDIEPIIERTLGAAGVDVWVYDLHEKGQKA